MNTLEGEMVAVVGLAASGRAAAWLALEKGGEVHVSDLRTDAATHARGAELRALGAEVDLGEHPVDRIAGAATVVVSPGIRPDAPVLEELGERGVRWISEPEFAFRFFDGPLIAVTGTNGKTTTAALVAHLLEEDGLDVALGGNIGAAFGPPASELALREQSPAWYVVEMSSFQLAAIDRFKPDIGVMTNLAPDHLDWYPSVESYYADKANLFRNADDDSRWVLNGDDPAVAALAEGVPGRPFFFSRASGGRPGAYLEGDLLTLNVSDEPETLGHVEKIPLLGGHNVENALAAATTARLAGASPESIWRGLSTAKPLPHRTEVVAEAKGVRWVNDSKATNVAAARSAIASLDGALLVLLGGKDKGEELSTLVSALSKVDARVLTFGQAGQRIFRALDGHVPVELLHGGFDELMEVAAQRAVPGTTVLLSPACSSYDMFTSYEERGARFAALAQAISEDPER
ncbi:MAG: UDP-N-acetylmuramoyl-L-alanine--D-glutamate ligase [Gemmatimonadetes bacterium]|nr:UDP-N-acetylmuramoyl-L-alanine--D-glutamate ligase [Gemmatimonadota bacterium]